jgi:PhnB protein
MAVQLCPYLQFEGNAREAMTHYREVLGGELDITTFGEFGQAGTPIEDLVMHASLETPRGLAIMASDTSPDMEYRPGTTVTVILSGDEEEVLRGYWEGLSAGGEVTVPLEQQMWGDLYGACTDRFGISWQVNIAAATEPA